MQWQSTWRAALLAIGLLCFSLSFLWLAKPLREYFASTILDESKARLLAGTLVRLVLVGFTIMWIRRFKHMRFVGMHTILKVKNAQAVLFALCLIVMMFASNWSVYLDADGLTLLLFMVSVLLVGLFEELLFRGVLFPLLIKALAGCKNPLVLAAISSSLLFGVVHFVNLFSQPDNWSGILSQVCFATAIGVYFSGLLLRTENILVPILIHVLVNFTFGASELMTQPAVVEEAAEKSTASMLATAVFFLFIFSGGIYMILKSEEEAVLQKLDL